MPDFPPSSARLERLIKLTDPVLAPAVGISGASLGTITIYGLYTPFTLASPGTTYTTVFSATGQGNVLVLFVRKPATVNAVSVTGRLTIDGAVVFDTGVTPGSTGALAGPLIGAAVGAEGSDVGTGHILTVCPLMIPFHRSALFEAKFSGTPGAGENITGGYFVVATG